MGMCPQMSYAAGSLLELAQGLAISPSAGLVSSVSTTAALRLLAVVVLSLVAIQRSEERTSRMHFQCTPTGHGQGWGSPCSCCSSGWMSSNVHHFHSKETLILLITCTCVSQHRVCMMKCMSRLIYVMFWWVMINAMLINQVSSCHEVLCALPTGSWACPGAVWTGSLVYNAFGSMDPMNPLHQMYEHELTLHTIWGSSDDQDIL